jgi:hypothetical protein
VEFRNLSRDVVDAKRIKNRWVGEARLYDGEIRLRFSGFGQFVGANYGSAESIERDE